MPENDIDLMIARQAKLGAETLGGVTDPSQYMGQVNNPLAKTLLAMSAGYSAGSKIPSMSGGIGDVAAALQGGAAGAQMQQDSLTLSQVSPQLAEAFPELSDTKAKMAYELMGKLQTYFAQKNKPANVFSEDDLPMAGEALKSRGYSDADVARIVPTLLGQPKNSIAQFQVKNRPPRRLLDLKVTRDNWGIATRLQGKDSVSNDIVNKKFDENMKASQNIAGIQKANNSMNVLRRAFDSLDLYGKQELIKEADGYVDSNIGDEAGFVQRAVGVVRKALARPGLGKEQGQKLQAFINALEANIPMIARGLGHTGVLTELDVMKSFGIAPNPTGTEIENAERERIYNEIIRGNVEAVLNGTTPIMDNDGNLVPAYDEDEILVKIFGKKSSPAKPIQKESVVKSGANKVYDKFGF